MIDNPHLQIAPVLTGAPPERCACAAVLVHGRDQDQELMLDVVRRLALDDVTYLLPVAAGRSWYEGRYFDPVAALGPRLDHALDMVGNAIDRLLDAGVPYRRIVVVGFSQGASLVAEFLARGGATREGEQLMGAGVLTGSLIGEPGARTVPSQVAGLAMYFSVSRHDPWLTLDEAQASVDAFADAGAVVRFDVLDDREHLVSDASVDGLRGLLGR